MILGNNTVEIVGGATFAYRGLSFSDTFDLASTALQTGCLFLGRVFCTIDLGGVHGQDASELS